MLKNTLFFLVNLCLVLSEILATENKKSKQRTNIGHNGATTTKTDIPTAEQLLSTLFGNVKKTPEPTPVQQFESVTTAPQTVPVLCPNNPQARSPLKTILSNIQLVPNRALPPPPPGYHYEQPCRNYGQSISNQYGRPRSPPKYADEYGKSYGNEDEQEEEEDSRPQNDDDSPAEDDYHSQRFGIGRGRGRQLCGRKQGCGQCNCVCWKGIKPHVEWVRVPVCYRPCAVCCPKHEEEGACASVCHPCCECCHCCKCCCHQPCHCCHCCHCCRRCWLLRPPIAPRKLKKSKSKTPNKKTKLKKKKTVKKSRKKTTKKKQ